MKMTMLGCSLMFLGCAGCATQYQPTAVSPQTGYLSSATHARDVARASVTVNRKAQLNKYQGIVLVTSTGLLSAATPFLRDEFAVLGGFSDAIDEVELQRRLIASGVQDKVSETHDLLGLNQAYRAYKPFLWAHFKVAKDDGRHVVMTVTDPGNGQDLFQANVDMPPAPTITNGNGGTDPDTTTDEDTWYPLFNSFIDWVTANGGKIAQPAAAGSPRPGP